MAEDSDLERTEPASSRRLEQAREDGRVPQSRELSAFLVLLAGVSTLWMMGGWFAQRAQLLLRNGLQFGHEQAFDPYALVNAFLSVATEALILLSPLFLVAMLAALAGSLMLGGVVFSAKALAPDFKRINPLSGLKRILSVQGIVELVKSVLKAMLVGGVVYWVVIHQQDALFALLSQPLERGVISFGDILIFAMLALVSGVALVSLIDVPFQLWQYHSKLRMTKEEVRQEHKEQEGDPQLKGRIRSQQREMARRRMMADIPKADVVVTNPTHYAVALKYDSAQMGAPQVLAKGINLVAQNIREQAAAHQVPLLEAPPLARALYRHCDIGDQIPAALYTAVAEVMAYVYQLQQYFAGDALPPQAPQGLPVPAELDPGADLLDAAVGAGG